MMLMSVMMTGDDEGARHGWCDGKGARGQMIGNLGRDRNVAMCEG